ncbi:GAGA-binding transcriptional activator [Dillenia turbinata]|uniref:GAGA-binding transcriptional activator n=1 Tax=Dillenia turbinata TaxID=194707 RepID=A0AAN8W714_9MAGN
MKRAGYPDRNPVISEAKPDVHDMHFLGNCWVHPINFLSATKATSSTPLQANHIHQGTGLNIAPMRTLHPPGEPEKKPEAGTKPKKVKKQKTAADGTNHVASKAVKPKQPRKKNSESKKTKGPSNPSARREKKNLDFVIDATTLDFSEVPSPVCSCTGIARQCYRWGAGGWQSSCCTTIISEYPLPMSPSRPGSRLAGRKMSNGAYGKLLMRLAAEGYDLTHPIDLKDHWARHGTNKI